MTLYCYCLLATKRSLEERLLLSAPDRKKTPQHLESDTSQSALFRALIYGLINEDECASILVISFPPKQWRRTFVFRKPTYKNPYLVWGCRIECILGPRSRHQVPFWLGRSSVWLFWPEARQGHPGLRSGWPVVPAHSWCGTAREPWTKPPNEGGPFHQFAYP